VIRLSLIFAILTAGPFHPAISCEGLEIESAWVRQSPPGLSVNAAYMVLRNSGTKHLRITEVRSSNYESAMFHQTVHTEGQARMRHIPEIELGPGSTFRAEPNGAHIMLNGPKQPIKTGKSVALNFECQSGNSSSILVTVREHAQE